MALHQLSRLIDALLLQLGTAELPPSSPPPARVPLLRHQLTLLAHRLEYFRARLSGVTLSPAQSKKCVKLYEDLALLDCNQLRPWASPNGWVQTLTAYTSSSEQLRLMRKTSRDILFLAADIGIRPPLPISGYNTPSTTDAMCELADWLHVKAVVDGAVKSRESLLGDHVVSLGDAVLTAIDAAISTIYTCTDSSSATSTIPLAILNSKDLISPSLRLLTAEEIPRTTNPDGTKVAPINGFGESFRCCYRGVMVAAKAVSTDSFLFGAYGLQEACRLAQISSTVVRPSPFLNPILGIVVTNETSVHILSPLAPWGSLYNLLQNPSSVIPVPESAKGGARVARMTPFIKASIMADIALGLQHLHQSGMYRRNGMRCVFYFCVSYRFLL
jgi:hypothetical protein